MAIVCILDLLLAYENSIIMVTKRLCEWLIIILNSETGLYLPKIVHAKILYLAFMQTIELTGLDIPYQSLRFIIRILQVPD